MTSGAAKCWTLSGWRTRFAVGLPGRGRARACRSAAEWVRASPPEWRRLQRGVRTGGVPTRVPASPGRSDPGAAADATEPVFRCTRTGSASRGRSPFSVTGAPTRRSGRPDGIQPIVQVHGLFDPLAQQRYQDLVDARADVGQVGGLIAIKGVQDIVDGIATDPAGQYPRECARNLPTQFAMIDRMPLWPPLLPPGRRRMRPKGRSRSS